MREEAKTISKIIFPDNTVQKTSRYTDHNGENTILVDWKNLNPALIFSFQSTDNDRPSYWTAVKERMNDAPMKPKCWSDFFQRIAVSNEGNPLLKNQNVGDKDQNILVVGLEIELNGETCWHGLPTPHKQSTAMDKVVVCTKCLGLNHYAKNCNETPFHKQNRGRGKGKSRIRGSRNRPKGACWYCGQFGHSRQKCPSPTPYCVRCKTSTHSSEPSTQCPAYKRQAAFNRRKYSSLLHYF